VEGGPPGTASTHIINPLRSPMFHRVVTGFGLRLHGRPIPPSEVSKGLLDVAARKLGDNVLADVWGSIPPIFAKSGSNLADAPRLAQAAGATEHRSMSD